MTPPTDPVHPTDSTHPSNPADRRESPRLEIEAPVSALVLSASRPQDPVQIVRVLNVSFGGFLVEGAAPLEPGEIYDFRFKTNDRKRPAVFKARAIYRVERAQADPDAAFACGFAFLNADDPFTLWRIRDLMDAVMPAV